MKKVIFVLSVLVLILSACNKKKKKGTYCIYGNGSYQTCVVGTQEDADKECEKLRSIGISHAESVKKNSCSECI